MYVFMYACKCIMNVCMYVCMYACMCLCMHVFVCLYVCMHACMYVRVCMYVCMYVCVYLSMLVTGRRSASFHLPRELGASVVTVHYEEPPTKRKPCHSTSTPHTLQFGPMCPLSRPQ